MFDRAERTLHTIFVVFLFITIILSQATLYQNLDIEFNNIKKKASYKEMSL